MFDIGFWELALIAVIALIVLGPEKLPTVARTAGLWLGKARHFIATVKADIDRELQAEELKRSLQNNADLSELKEVLNATRNEIEQDIHPDYLVKAQDTPPAAAPTAPPPAPAVAPPAAAKPEEAPPAASPEHDAEPHDTKR